MAGFATVIVSRNPDQLTDLPAGTVAAGPDLPSGAPPDLIIENIPEDMELKLELLGRIEAAYGDHPVVATNTSSLPIDELAAGLKVYDPHHRRYNHHHLRCCCC